ncbi:hypothetical protein U1Q18_041345, partial [Sarracenia purpurea var. burkii]
MAMANVSSASPLISFSSSLLLLLPSSSFPSSSFTSSKIPSYSSPPAAFSFSRKRSALFFPSFALQKQTCKAVDDSAEEEEGGGGGGEEVESSGTESVLYSFTPLPLLFVAALPGAGTVRSLFGPFTELVKSWNLPDWLVHWGHPANMAVVLFAMGGYGTYLGFRIRFSEDV